MSECVSQTVLAVAIQCGPYCLWVCLGGEGGGSTMRESEVIVFLLYCMYLSICLE